MTVVVGCSQALHITQVRTSPEAPKRQFLENKGLTTAEIDEAFRRVPQQDTTTTELAPMTPPPSKPFHNTMAAAPAVTTQQLAPAPPPVQRLRWSQVVMGAALLAAGAYTAHSLLWPRAQQLYSRWTASWREAQRRQEEQAAAHAKVRGCAHTRCGGFDMMMHHHHPPHSWLQTHLKRNPQSCAMQ